mgnify:CR=1 FL=1
MVHIYYGDGKGKTSAAVGAALRAVGRGWRVGFAQFLKDGCSGECAPLAAAGVKVYPAPNPLPFTFAMTAADCARVRAFYAARMRTIQADLPTLDMLVLDEASDAVSAGLLDEAALLALLDAPRLELILTCHSLPKTLAARADYLTEMKKHRHPYDVGVVAREGVEY